METVGRFGHFRPGTPLSVGLFMETKGKGRTILLCVRFGRLSSGCLLSVGVFFGRSRESYPYMWATWALQQRMPLIRGAIFRKEKEEASLLERRCKGKAAYAGSFAHATMGQVILGSPETIAKPLQETLHMGFPLSDRVQRPETNNGAKRLSLSPSG